MIKFSGYASDLVFSQLIKICKKIDFFIIQTVKFYEMDLNGNYN